MILVKFVKKLNLAKDFFAPRYFAKHTKKFRRLSAEHFFVEDINYHTWSFSSPKIPIGIAFIPPIKADHMLLFSLEKTENIYSVPYRINNYLKVNETTVEQLIPGQKLYITIDDWGKLQTTQ